MSGPNTARGAPNRRKQVQHFVLILVATVLLALFSLFTWPGQALDTLTMDAAIVHLGRFQTAARWVVEVSPVTVGAAVLVLALVVLASRKRPELLGRSLVLVFAANLVTQLLKAFLVRPDLGVGHPLGNSFTSGHVTMAASLAVVAVAASNCSWRKAVSTVVGFVVFAQALAVLTLGWHRLSDVLGALLIVWAANIAAAPGRQCPADTSLRAQRTARRWTKMRVTVFGLGTILLAAVGIYVLLHLRPPVVGAALMHIVRNGLVGAALVLGGALLIAATTSALVSGVDRRTVN